MANEKNRIIPISEADFQHAPRLVVAASWKDEDTGALYIHQDLVKVQEPWAKEGHIPPMKVTERFGDVESFAAYVQRYGNEETLAYWNSTGIKAILDYADEKSETSGRGQWIATFPFVGSLQWGAWKQLANGQAVSQKTAVERLEDLVPDIVEPAPTDLMNLLRNLRASVKANAEAEMRPDGTTSVMFAQDKTIKSAGFDLPSAFTISIPVLKGHVDAEGRPVLYRLQVRLRVNVDDSAHLALRFTMPQSDRVLEDVYSDRVNAAIALLGDAYDLLRAAD